MARFGAKRVSRMKKDSRLIQSLLSHSEDGYSTAELLARLPEQNTKRSLQRLLAELVEQGVIRREGLGRATRYYLPFQVREPEQEYSIESIIPFSKSALAAKNIIHQPLSLRKPVSYQRQFLEDYKPNKTPYLPSSVTEKLHRLGKQPSDIVLGETFTKKILDSVLIDLSWNSSRLEGNTYSLLETQRLLEYKEFSDQQSLQDAQMILNHKAAIEFIVENANSIDINKATILQIHALLSDGLIADPKSIGQLRKIPVAVGRTVYIPLALPPLIEELFVLILEKGSAIQDPIEQAFFMMVHIPYLQAFEDVNKRTSRLVANIPLIKNNYCPFSFIDLPKKDYVDGILAIYELNDISILADVFVWAYFRSIQRYSGVKEAMGQVDPIRFRYRQEIFQVINHIVTNKLKLNSTVFFIQEWAEQHIRLSDQQHFIEVVQTEIMYLTETNCIRYKISVDVFHAWEKVFKIR